MVAIAVNKMFLLKSQINYHVTSKIKYMPKRKIAGVKFLDSNRKADESIHFKKEDEILLKNLLKKNPDLNPDYDLSESEHVMDNLSQDLALVFSKYGLKALDNGDAIRDVIKVFELNGYKKSLDQ
ncbi:conserved protein, unknown function [Hepatocystis sp. ex Piliocolobus tephrosceles]|nr:conserved protein, unknown function [Hepatocystis sp. ex Piliocolobus tephrosceles]